MTLRRPTILKLTRKMMRISWCHRTITTSRWCKFSHRRIYQRPLLSDHILRKRQSSWFSIISSNSSSKIRKELVRKFSIIKNSCSKVSRRCLKVYFRVGFRVDNFRCLLMKVSSFTSKCEVLFEIIILTYFKNSNVKKLLNILWFQAWIFNDLI